MQQVCFKNIVPKHRSHDAGKYYVEAHQGSTDVRKKSDIIKGKWFFRARRQKEKLKLLKNYAIFIHLNPLANSLNRIKHLNYATTRINNVMNPYSFTHTGLKDKIKGNFTVVFLLFGSQHIQGRGVNRTSNSKESLLAVGPQTQERRLTGRKSAHSYPNNKWPWWGVVRRPYSKARMILRQKRRRTPQQHGRFAYPLS